jgi:hypothetical protein
MQVNSDYRDLLLRFNEAGVRYLVVGGYAVMKYTEPFYTKDLDLWVDPAADNASKVFAALQAFGAPMADLTIQDLTTPGVFFQIGIAPNRIDVMTDVPGLQFADSWARAGTFAFGEVTAPVLSREDILLAKQTANRPEDRVAVRRLKLAAKQFGKARRRNPRA